MTIDTEQQKPWYHGVRWIKSDGANSHVFEIKIVDHQDNECVAFSELFCADLIAAAPETATERDNLKAEIERLRKLFKHADSKDWGFLLDILTKAERHDQDAETQLWISAMQDFRAIIQGASSCK